MEYSELVAAVCHQKGVVRLSNMKVNTRKMKIKLYYSRKYKALTWKHLGTFKDEQEG